MYTHEGKHPRQAETGGWIRNNIGVSPVVFKPIFSQSIVKQVPETRTRTTQDFLSSTGGMMSQYPPDGPQVIHVQVSRPMGLRLLQPTNPHTLHILHEPNAPKKLSGHGLTDKEVKAVLDKLESRVARGSRSLAVHAANNRLSGTAPLAALNPNMAMSLVELHLSHNRIKVAAGLEALTNLKVLDLSYNKLARRGDLRALSFNERLRVLFLVGNPLAESLTAQEFRSVVRHLLLGLHSMDGTAFSSPSLLLAPSQKVNASAAAAATARFEVNSYLVLHMRGTNHSTDHNATHVPALCLRNSASNSYGLTKAQQTRLPSRTTPTVPPPFSQSRLKYIPPWRRVPKPLPKGWGRFNVPSSVAGYVSPSARIESALASATVSAMCG